PKANITDLSFMILPGAFIIAIVHAASQYFAYLLTTVCLAMAVRQWYNPRKLRRNLFETFQAMGETVYKISVGESYADISTVCIQNVENSVETDGDYEPEPLPEKSRIPFDENFSMLEYERFFLMFSGKTVFYIIPKENFTENENDILRNLK
ncbi:MAG: YcxB family protein, partial [Ruminococcus sp.]|nr:YcxB family protein [Ruminococcus sp.]